MSEMKISYRQVSFETVEAGEFFQWGDNDGEIYVKIKVQKYRRMSDAEKKERKSIFDVPRHNRYTYDFAALNIRTMETNYDISGGNIQCVRLKGYIGIEAHPTGGPKHD